jgi:hypothetical protein
MAINEERGNRESDPLFDDPPRRRWWLLTKALEGAPLQEALETALAADLFIVEGVDGLSPEHHPIGASDDAKSGDVADWHSEDEAQHRFVPTAGQSRYRH